MIEHQHRRAVGVYQLQLLYDFHGVLFFRLLDDEPLEHHLGGVILLFERQFVQSVDGSSHRGLTGLHFLEGLQAGFPFAVRGGNRLECHAPAAVYQIIVELHAMFAFLFHLDTHPGGKAGQVFIGKVARYGKVQVCRV